MQASQRTFNVAVRRSKQTVRSEFTARYRKIAFTLWSRLVLYTPWDTGYARSRWGVGVNGAPLSENDSLDPTGAATIAQGFAEIGSSPIFAVYEFGNDAPYIGRLEDGYSPQRRSGITSPALRDIDILFI